MDEQFEFPVEYKGNHLVLKASLLVTGYTHKFIIYVEGQVVIFEPDEQREYRAVIPFEDIANKKNIDVELLKTIAAAIEQLVK